MSLKNQAKEIIMVILTLLIAVSISQSSEYPFIWFGIVLLGIVQVTLVFVQSVEEKAYWEEANHNHQLKRKKWDYDEQCEDIKLKGKLKKLQEKSENKKKMENYIKLEEVEKLMEIIK